MWRILNFLFLCYLLFVGPSYADTCKQIIDDPLTNTSLTAGDLEDYTHISYKALDGIGIVELAIEAPGDLVSKTITLIGESDAYYPSFTALGTSNVILMADMTMELKLNCILILVWCNAGGGVNATRVEVFRYDPNN